jgi:hypothetical protein
MELAVGHTGYVKVAGSGCSFVWNLCVTRSVVSDGGRE